MADKVSKFIFPVKTGNTITEKEFELPSGPDDLGTAAYKDVPSSGNASSSQVVMGNDSRLTDSRNAKDVYSWAKASSKPTYTASEVGAIATSAKGTANGVAELDSTGKVPSSQLPSYVDDVLEYDSLSAFPSTGETGKIYTAKDTNKTYRWTGSAYSQIKGDLSLGETSSTAYRGDRGKTAYDHSQSTHARTDATKTEASSTNGNIKINGTETTVYTHPGSGTNPHGTTKSDVGLGNVGNFKAVSTVASQGLTDTEKSNARANIGAGTSSSDTKVTQTATSTSAEYEVLFSNSANNTTETAGARKDSGLTFNPSTDTLTTKYVSNKAIKALTGSGTAGSDAGSGVSPRYTPSKWTINAGVTVANGEVYFVKIPVAGGTYGVWLSLNNGTNYYPVAISTGKSRFTTHYPKDTVIALTYESASACTCYALAGADSTADVTGCFRVLNDYDANTTYSSKAAASGGTATSLCTTGEKYTWNNKANTASPTFTGTPKAPTASAGTNTTQIATTAFVASACSTLQSNFQAGVDSVYDAVVAKGSTPASKSLSDVVSGIGNISTPPPTQEKYVTPSPGGFYVWPDSGYNLWRVGVNNFFFTGEDIALSYTKRDNSTANITIPSGPYIYLISLQTSNAAQSITGVKDDAGIQILSYFVNKGTPRVLIVRNISGEDRTITVTGGFTNLLGFKVTRLSTYST